MPVQPDSTASSARYSSAWRHRQVLADDGDLAAFVGEVLGHGEDASVVVSQPESGREGRSISVVELHAEGAPLVTDGHRGIEAAGLDAEVIEKAQGAPGEEAELGMVPLGLELGDDDHGEDDLVLLESQDRLGVREQDRGVQDIRELRGLAGGGRGHVGAPCRFGRAPRTSRCVGRDATTRPNACTGPLDGVSANFT